MLNKRIKSLLVAGLLVMSMTGGVFAAESELPTTGTSIIEHPDFGDRTFKDFKFQDDNIILTLYDDSDGYRAVIKWVAENFKVTGIKMTYEDGTYSIMDIKLPGETEEGQDCYDAVLNGDLYNVAINDKTDKKLVKVEVMFINLTKDDKPVTPPVEPKEEITDPETGDASIIPIVATAVISAAGLYVVSRKDDEE